MCEPLGITIDSEQPFKNHINKLCKKASQKLNVLPRIFNYLTSDFNYMTFDKKKNNNESFHFITT